MITCQQNSANIRETEEREGDGGNGGRRDKEKIKKQKIKGKEEKKTSGYLKSNVFFVVFDELRQLSVVVGLAHADVEVKPSQ